MHYQSKCDNLHLLGVQNCTTTLDKIMISYNLNYFTYCLMLLTITLIMLAISIYSYFENDSSIPIYSRTAPSYLAESAVEVIFNTSYDKISSKQPIGVTESSTFIVDTSKLGHKDDIRSDDLGVWRNGGVKSQYCSVTFSDGRVTKALKLSCKPSAMRSSVYRVKRSYWHHADDKTFCRHLIELEGDNFYC